MNRQEQLGWEARVGRQIAPAAFASAILQFVALVYGTSAIKPQTVNGVKTVTADRVDGLRVASEHHSQVLTATALQCVAIALLAAPLWFLYHAARARRSETPPAARYMAIIGPLALAIVTAINQVVYLHVADRVTNHLLANPAAPQAADDYATAQLKSITVVQGIGLAAALAVAFALVLISLNAMRAGLLSRFMGILGIIVGVLFVLPILGQIPFVEIFWVAALGALFIDRWPQGGRGPAWDSGEAIPWPTAQQRAAEAAERRAAAEADRDDDEPEPVRETVPPDLDGHDVVREHPRSKKRKRKRR
jgi:hypothetical protein